MSTIFGPNKWIAALITLNSACGGLNREESNKPKPEATAAVPAQEEPIAPVAPIVSEAARTPLIGAFLRSSVAAQQSVRMDHAQVLLANDKGELAVVGVSRSKLQRTDMIEPSLAGDMFFARFKPGSGWDGEPIQAAVKLPPAPVPAASATPAPAATPLASALLRVRGGRMLSSGKAMVAGELDDISFAQSQLNLEETEPASRNIFLSIFGAGSNGVIKSLRYGIQGDNSLASVADSPKSSGIVMAGFTTAGLLKSTADRISSETASPSNFIAELNEEGAVMRFASWPKEDVTGQPRSIQAVSSNAEYLFVANGQDNAPMAFVRSVRMPDHRSVFQRLPERQVCAEASQGATSVRVVSMDATEKELVVAVEIRTSSVGAGFVLPCFEVFDIKEGGTIVARRESVFLKDHPTLESTVNVRLVDGSKILLSRSRENTDSRGRVGVVVSFLFDRKDLTGSYQSRVWSISRPAEWYGSDEVNGLYRRVVQMLWPKGGARDIAWIVSNDVTDINGSNEVLTHIANYRVDPTAED
jgi:hypothetical protein